VDTTYDVKLFDVNKVSKISKGVVNTALQDNRIQELILNGIWFGELQQIGSDFLDQMTVDLRNIAFKICNYYWVDDILYGVIMILGTPNGKILESCINKVDFKMKGLYSPASNSLILTTFVAY